MEPPKLCGNALKSKFPYQSGKFEGAATRLYAALEPAQAYLTCVSTFRELSHDNVENLKCFCGLPPFLLPAHADPH